MCVHEKDVVFPKFNYLMQWKINQPYYNWIEPYAIHTHTHTSANLTTKTRMQKLMSLKQIKEIKLIVRSQSNFKRWKWAMYMNKITAVVAAIHLCVNCMIYNTKLIMQTIDLKIPFRLGVRDFGVKFP